jgi:hypothetical protein
MDMIMPWRNVATTILVAYDSACQLLQDDQDTCGEESCSWDWL